ncbi:hypothetical protein IP84_03060 [beta proteobacterium AAP99]|nr:hypothetical protein IP84_03060 [beta proteobacterium AAP99]
MQSAHNISWLPAGVRRGLIGLVCALAFGACSPKFDWREMPAANERVTALFPAKPESATRQVMLGAASYVMTLTGARVDQAQFAAGYLEVPEGRSAQAVAAEWAAAMQANLRGAAAAAPKTVQVAGAEGAIEVAARGTVEGSSGQLLARFAWRGGDVFCAIALGPDRSLSAEAAEQFVTSLKLR